MKKKILFLLLSSIFMALHAGYAQDKPLKKIIWGVTSLSASQWIPWIAKDAKIYQKYGLDTELVLLRGSGQSAQAIIGNSILAAPCTLTTVMGADFGSLGDFLERYIIKKYGLEPGRDVVMLSIGTQPERIQALETGAVDAADLSFPADVQATRKGFKVLWDAKQEVSYPSMSVVLRRKSITDDRDTVMRMVKAHIEAIHFLKANKEASTKILGKYLKTSDRELLDGSYEIYRNDFISVPYPITQGLQPTYEYVALQRPEIWNHKPEEFMDPSFISELDKSGFIKSLSQGVR